MCKTSKESKQDYACECAAWTDNTLISKEVSHRRALASYITSLTLTAGSTVGSAGALAPLTVPIASFKLYKIKSHRSKLKIVRTELAKRHLTTALRQKRDIIIPVAVTFTAYTITFGLADAVDLVPSDMQDAFQSQVEALFGVEEGVSVYITM
jgi:hypothetical protein